MHAIALVMMLIAAPETQGTQGAVVNIVPRAAWDPSPRARGYRYRGRLKDIYRTIVVHHSDFEEPPGPVGIKDYHLHVSGFSDIGYHFVIGADGAIYEARALDRMGAHAGITKESRGDHTKDPDWGSVGIVLDGRFSANAPPAAQLQALDALIVDLRQRLPKVERVIGHAAGRAKGLPGRWLVPAPRSVTRIDSLRAVSS